MLLEQSESELVTLQIVVAVGAMMVDVFIKISSYLCFEGHWDIALEKYQIVGESLGAPAAAMWLGDAGDLCELQ